MKVLVVLKDLYTGGIQKSCVNFVNYLSKNKIVVDLVLFNPEGPLRGQISNAVNIIEANCALLPFAVSQGDAKTWGAKFFFKRTIFAIWAKLFGNKRILKNALKKQYKLDKSYDVAISFAPSTGLKTLTVGGAEFVLEKTEAKQKWIFVHGDYERSGLNEPYANVIFSKFDKVFCVSKSCAELMKKANKKLAEKIDYIYNVCDVEDIKKKAEEKIEEKPNDKFELITVARLSEEKGHIRLLEQLKNLHVEGFDFLYTIVGDGKERTSIEKFIKENNMSSYVDMVGNKSNPYPYIKRADLFVLPSYHESYGLVLVESMILGVPVLTTKTSAAEEVVLDNGFICENNADSLYQCLKQQLLDKNGIKQKENTLLKYKYKIDDRIIELLRSTNIDKK